MVSAAIAISSEATTITNHANRVVLARLTLNNPQNYVNQFTLAVAVNLAVTTVSTVTDAQIDGAVSAVWNGFAGVP